MTPDAHLHNTRVLHILHGECGAMPWPHAGRDTAGEAEQAACAGIVRACHGFNHDVIVLGGSRDSERCVRLGLGRHWRVTPGALGREGRSLIRCVDRLARPGVIMAWGRRAGLLARECLAGVAPVVSVDFHAGTLLGDSGLNVPLSPSLIEGTDDDRGVIRRRLGLTDADMALGLLDDPADAGDAVGFLFIAGVLRVAGIRVTAVLSRRTHGYETAMRHVREIGYVSRVIATDLPMVWIARGADVCIAGARQDAHERPPRIGELALASIAASAGVATIMNEGSLLDHTGYPALLRARTSRPTEFARRLVPLLTEPHAREQAGTAARAWAEQAEPMHAQVMRAWELALGAGALR